MNVLIHAGGGKVAAEIFQDHTVINITDHGPGIPDIKLAMQEAGRQRRIISARWGLAPVWACPT